LLVFCLVFAEKGKFGRKSFPEHVVDKKNRRYYTCFVIVLSKSNLMNQSKNPNNILPEVQQGWCTGCGTCAAFCSFDALEIEYTLDGRYIPRVIESKCTNCGLCKELCPAANENYKQLNQFVFGKMPENKFLGNFINCYTGYTTDDGLRYKATSGGVITSLLLFALREGLIDGAVLTRFNNEDPLKAEPFIARTREEILSAIGSKYVPVPVNLMLKKILAEDGRFAFVGLPCHLWGVRRAELKFKELKKKIVFHFGLVCSHTICAEGVKFILKKLKIQKSQIKRLQYRGDGWPSGLKVKLDNGIEEIVPNQKSWWSEIFGGYYFTPFYCNFCNDHMNEFADISFADAWLSKIVQSDPLGTSIVITKTKVGNDLIDRAAVEKKIRLFALDVYDVVRSQSFPVLFKKRNIHVRMKVLAIAGKKLPKNLRENKSYFLKPTLFDYPATTIVYNNIFISRNKIFKKLLLYTPFCLLCFNRILLKQFVCFNKKKIIGAIKSPKIISY
jgi:coenzyme F420 hydrogenase subunit beta